MKDKKIKNPAAQWLGRRRQKSMLQELGTIEYRKAKSEAGKKGAAKRWEGHVAVDRSKWIVGKGRIKPENYKPVKINKGRPLK